MRPRGESCADGAWLAAILIGCASCAFTLFAADAVKGHLVIIGGGETPVDVLQEFVNLAGGAQNARIVVIPMASDKPVESGKGQVETFKRLGVREATSLLIGREEASKEEILESLDQATGVYFTGGDQTRLATNLVGTLAHEKLLEIYRRGAVIGGTSAGAAIMSAVMITGEQALHTDAKDGFTSIHKGNVVTRQGLGFVTNAIIDQHFITRKRQNRLFGLVLENPRLLGVGIDEKTAVVVRPNAMMEVIGDGQVMIFDARQTTGVRTDRTRNLAGRSVQTHLLIAGDRFDPSGLASAK